MSSIFDWSASSAAANATADASMNWQEGQDADTVNDSARVLVMRVAQVLDDIGGVPTSGGAANAQTLTTVSPWTATADGLIVGFVAGFSNSSSTTLNANTTGNINLYAHGAACVGGEIVAGGIYLAMYDLANTRWNLLNPKAITAAASAIANTPSGNISAVTVQAAINELDTEKQPLDATLTALAGVATAADKYIYATGVDAFSTDTITTFGRSLIDDAAASNARTTLGLVIGTNVQAQGPTLDTIEALTLVAGDILYATAADTVTRLAKGTSGQVLSIGASAPAWISGATQIATSSPSGVATVSFTSIPQTYSALMIVVSGISISSATLTTPTISYSVDNGGAYSTATAGTSALSLGSNLSSAATVQTTVHFIWNYSNTGPKFTQSSAATNAANDASTTATNMLWNSATAVSAGINALQAATANGTFDAGSITIYGIH